MYKLPEGHVLCMRTCDNNLKSHGGFQWPESGEVVCPDWDAKPECGNGLHGLPWGTGEASLLNWSHEAKWLAVEVDEKAIVNLDGKVKFPVCRVVLVGDRKAVTDLIAKHAPNGTAVIGLVQDGGYRSTITGGDYSTITGGDGSTITGGDYSTITGGYYSTITGGYGSTITGGYGSTLVLTYWDSKSERHRCVIRYVGEDGIKVGVAYVADGMGGLKEAANAK